MEDSQFFSVYTGERRNKTCLIVGTDGFDSCVLLNLIAFYTELGFDVMASNSVRTADLVVLMRYNIEPEGRAAAFANLPKDVPIHIYPYVGYSPEILVNQLRGRPVSVFAPSERLLCTLNDAFQCIALPPVEVRYWARECQERTLKFVHVGNLKPREKNSHWPELDELIEILQSPESHLWGGNGWDVIPGIKNFYGQIPVFAVPLIYQRTKYALGLMYQFQRDAGTFSSRFFQAPLCGAALICERDVTSVFPGIYSVGLKNATQKLSEIENSPDEIQKEAIVFWLSEREKLIQKVITSLKLFPPTNTQQFSCETLRYAPNTMATLYAGELVADAIYSAQGLQA